MAYSKYDHIFYILEANSKRHIRGKKRKRNRTQYFIFSIDEEKVQKKYSANIDEKY